MQEAMTIICQVEECRWKYQFEGTVEELDFAVCPHCKTPRFPGKVAREPRAATPSPRPSDAAS